MEERTTHQRMEKRSSHMAKIMNNGAYSCTKTGIQVACFCQANSGRLLQPGPRDNGNYPPEGCIVLPEGRRRPKVEAARRQDNAAQRRIISSWPEGKVVIITFLYSRANNMVPDPGTISPKPGTMGPQTPTMNPLLAYRRTMNPLFAYRPTIPIVRGSWTQNNPNCSGFSLLYIVRPAI